MIRAFIVLAIISLPFSTPSYARGELELEDWELDDENRKERAKRQERIYRRTLREKKEKHDEKKEGTSKRKLYITLEPPFEIILKYPPKRYNMMQIEVAYVTNDFAIKNLIEDNSHTVKQILSRYYNSLTFRQLEGSLNKEKLLDKTLVITRSILELDADSDIRVLFSSYTMQ